jgi:hypothetical protein
MPGRKAVPAPPAVPPLRPRADALAVVALVVGSLAFLCGLLPVLGLILGVPGVVLGFLALRRSNRPGLGKAALILSSIAVASNLVINVIVIVNLVNDVNNLPT